ncbi:5-formyltetrahydrofolate cyclo-ligase [Bremerella sp. JC770]|uniref:5-formyltetrahydrofolate cyclo-ligase n=1 Tax=Bremerella sp. JC770 TaxID=3232137 RepID=UPI0034577444
MVLAQKNEIRRLAIARRQALDDAEPRSEAIGRRLFEEFPIGKEANWLVYVSVRKEVQTMNILEYVLRERGQVVVPYCLADGQLGLFRLTELEQLETGAYGIREPIAALRAKRTASPESIDTIVMPGVAFDRRGNRIGYGKGYFDRLLPRLRDDCTKIGLAFDCQVFPEVPSEPHDVPVDHLITETQSFRCSAEA